LGNEALAGGHTEDLVGPSAGNGGVGLGQESHKDLTDKV